MAEILLIKHLKITEINGKKGRLLENSRKTREKKKQEILKSHNLPELHFKIVTEFCRKTN